jgi:hypothetical protein
VPRRFVGLAAGDRIPAKVYTSRQDLGSIPGRLHKRSESVFATFLARCGGRRHGAKARLVIRSDRDD